MFETRMDFIETKDYKDLKDAIALLAKELNMEVHYFMYSDVLLTTLGYTSRSRLDRRIDAIGEKLNALLSYLKLEVNYREAGLEVARKKRTAATRSNR